MKNWEGIVKKMNSGRFTYKTGVVKGNVRIEAGSCVDWASDELLEELDILYKKEY